MYNLLARTDVHGRNFIFKLFENDFNVSFVPLGFAGFFYNSSNFDTFGKV